LSLAVGGGGKTAYSHHQHGNVKDSSVPYRHKHHYDDDGHDGGVDRDVGGYGNIRRHTLLAPGSDVDGAAPLKMPAPSKKHPSKHNHNTLQAERPPPPEESARAARHSNEHAPSVASSGDVSRVAGVRFADESTRHGEDNEKNFHDRNDESFLSSIATTPAKKTPAKTPLTNKRRGIQLHATTAVLNYFIDAPPKSASKSSRKQLNRSAFSRSLLLGGDPDNDLPPPFLRGRGEEERLHEDEEKEPGVDRTAARSPRQSLLLVDRDASFMDASVSMSSFPSPTNSTGSGSHDSSNDDNSSSSSETGGDLLMQSDPTQLTFSNYVQMAATTRPNFVYLTSGDTAATSDKRKRSSHNAGTSHLLFSSSHETSQRSTSMEHSVSIKSSAMATTNAHDKNDNATAERPASPDKESRSDFVKVSSPPGNYAVTNRATTWVAQQNLIHDSKVDRDNIDGGGKYRIYDARLPPRGQLSLPVSFGAPLTQAQSQPRPGTTVVNPSSPKFQNRRFSLPGTAGTSSPSLLALSTSDRPPPSSGSTSKRRTSNLLSIARNIKAQRLSRELDYKSRLSHEEDARRRSQEFFELSTQHENLQVFMSQGVLQNDPPARGKSAAVRNAASIVDAADATTASLDFLTKAIGSSPAISLLASKQEDSLLLESSPEESTTKPVTATFKEPPLVPRQIDDCTDDLTSISAILGLRSDAPPDSSDPQVFPYISKILSSEADSPQEQLDQEGQRRGSTSEGITGLLRNEANDDSTSESADSDAIALPLERMPSDASLSSRSGDGSPGGKNLSDRFKSSLIGNLHDTRTKRLQTVGLHRPPEAPSADSNRTVERSSSTAGNDLFSHRFDPTRHSPLQNAGNATEDIMAYEFSRQVTSSATQLHMDRMSTTSSSERVSDIFESSPSKALSNYNEGNITEELLAVEVLRPSITSSVGGDSERDRLSSASPTIDVGRLLAEQSPVSSTSETMTGRSLTSDSSEADCAPTVAVGPHKNPDSRRYSMAGPLQNIDELVLDPSDGETSTPIKARTQNGNQSVTGATEIGPSGHFSNEDASREPEGTSSNLSGSLSGSKVSKVSLLPNLNGVVDHSGPEPCEPYFLSERLEQVEASPAESFAAVSSQSASVLSLRGAMAIDSTEIPEESDPNPTTDALAPRHLKSHVPDDGRSTNIVDAAGDTGTIPNSVDHQLATTVPRPSADTDVGETSRLMTSLPQIILRPKSLSYSERGDEVALFSKRALDYRQNDQRENKGVPSGSANEVQEIQTVDDIRTSPRSEGSPLRASSTAFVDSPARNTRSAEKKRRQTLQDAESAERKRLREPAQKSPARSKHDTEEKQCDTPPSKRRSSQLHPSPVDSPTHSTKGSRLKLAELRPNSPTDGRVAESCSAALPRKRKEANNPEELEGSCTGDRRDSPILETSNNKRAPVAPKHVKFQSHDGYLEFNSQSPAMSVQTPVRSYKRQSRKPSPRGSTLDNPEAESFEGYTPVNEVTGSPKLLDALPSHDSHMSVDSELSVSDNSGVRKDCVDRTLNLGLDTTALRQTAQRINQGAVSQRENKYDDHQTLEKLDTELFEKDERCALQSDNPKHLSQSIQPFDAIDEDVTAELEPDFETLMRQAPALADDVTTDLETDFETLMRQATEFHEHAHLKQSVVGESLPPTGPSMTPSGSLCTRRFSLYPAQRKQTYTPSTFFALKSESLVDKTTGEVALAAHETSSGPLQDVELNVTNGELLHAFDLRDWSPMDLIDDLFQHLCTSITGYGATLVASLVDEDLSPELERNTHHVSFEDPFKGAENGKALQRALLGGSDSAVNVDLHLLAKIEQDKARAEMEMWLMGAAPVLESYLDGELQHVLETLSEFDFRSDSCQRASDWLSSSEDIAARRARRQSLGRRKVGLRVIAPFALPCLECTTYCLTLSLL
jgi:hypothetical protein